MAPPTDRKRGNPEGLVKALVKVIEGLVCPCHAVTLGPFPSETPRSLCPPALPPLP